MSGLLDRVRGVLRYRREQREEGALRTLKARYHGFRVLLADNDLALRHLAQLERGLAGRDAEAVTDAASRLLDTSYDLVDGLNRIADERHLGLYTLHQRLEAGINAALADLAPDQGPMPYCVSLDALDADTRRHAGGKAAALSLLRRAGLPVPDGFVVTTQACRAFLAATGVDRVVRRCMGQVELGKSVEVTGRQIRDAIFAAPIPDDIAKAMVSAWRGLGTGNGEGPAVSLRSSALVEDKPDHSFAGQFHSELNVTTAEGVLLAWREVLAGNFGPRPTSYRQQMGLPLADMDMAALCQRMVPARAAGVLFTVDPATPESGRMLITAVRGLGTAAVGGHAPADIFRPRREASVGEAPFDGLSQTENRATDMTGADTLDKGGAGEDEAYIAAKDFQEVADAAGGLRREPVPQAEQRQPAVPEDTVRGLAWMGRLIESLTGAPQDVEWAVDDTGGLHILQARAIRLSSRASETAVQPDGSLLLDAGTAASPGRAVGRARLVRSVRELEGARGAPGELGILVLRQSMVEAARILPDMDGVVVELGNPVDHLSCVARELGVPMLTGAQGAMDALEQGRWIVLDADRARVCEAPESVWRGLAASRAGEPRRRKRKQAAVLPPALARLHELAVPLHLTDAYGPTFSPMECRSVHDLIRFIHEKAVLAMFDAGDATLEEAGRLPVLLEDQALPFLILDLGGGLRPEHGNNRKSGLGGLRNVAQLADVRSTPLLALCRGMAAPGLRWHAPPPGANIAGLLSRSLLDSGSARPLGNFNYALVTRDYLNLNARVEYHFAMIDAVCGPTTGENAIHFRFKGGGTTREQRERRARLVSEILKAHGFFVDRQGDMTTGVLREIAEDHCQNALMMLGRLLGFTRLLDAAMTSDEAMLRLVAAFQEGDFGLEGFTPDAA